MCNNRESNLFQGTIAKRQSFAFGEQKNCWIIHPFCECVPNELEGGD